jgi:hypothetical protein
VVGQEDDVDTIAVCSAAATQFLNVRLVLVNRPGVVAAHNAGRRAARSEVIALTDDDAQPEAVCVEGIATEFAADPQLCALGGPDLPEGRDQDRADPRCVGALSWYGRMIGNQGL